MDLDLAKFIEHEGVLAAALVGLGVVVWRIGLRLTAAIDKAGDRFEHNTDRLLDRHAETHEAVSRIEAKLDSMRNQLF